MKRTHIAVAVVVALAYAGCFVAITLGLPYAPPLRFAGLRALIAGGVLIAASGAAGRGLIPPLRLRPWVLVLGAVLAVQYAAMFLSLQRAGAGLSSVLANTGPILLILLAAVFLEERITSITAGAVLVGAAGVALIAWPRAGEATLGLVTVALPLGVALGAAVETVLLKRLRVGSALMAVAGWQLLIGGVLLLGVSAVTEPAHIVWTAELMAAIAFLALPGTALGLGLWYWLVQREAVSRLAGFMFMVPVAGLLLAWAFFGETVTAWRGVGLLLALGGIALASGLVPGFQERAAAPATPPLPAGEE